MERVMITIDEHIQAGLVTLEKAQIRFYKADKK